MDYDLVNYKARIVLTQFQRELVRWT